MATRFSDLSDSEWAFATSGAVTVYGEESGTFVVNECSDGDACDEVWSLNEYGRLYNFYAVEDPRGLCPSGWHVSSYDELIVIRDLLGGEYDAGGHMKAAYGWGAWNGTNSSGFSGLPGGERNSGGQFYGAGGIGRWWTSSSDGAYARCYRLWSNNELINTSQPRRHGFSVRCIQD